MAKLLDQFAIFILTHGRPNRQDTLRSLEKAGYTGRIYLLVDNEDTTASSYQALYGQQVIIFDKAAIAATFDEGDNFADRRAVIYARNACFEVARNLGLKYFMELDDDYSSFDYRFDAQLQATIRPIRNLDAILEAVLTFYASIPALSVAFMQGGDFLGGQLSSHALEVTAYRKCMNTFILSTDRPFQFVGRINEDVNTYTWYQSLGHLFLSLNQLSVTQRNTQHNPGGMSDLYLDAGTYVKSFYTVMYAPSCTRIGQINSVHKRIHHLIAWENAVPVILPESARTLPVMQDKTR